MARRTRKTKAVDAPELEPVGSDIDDHEPLARLDLDDVTFETIQGSPKDTLARICRDNNLHSIGTQADLMSRLRRCKINQADRRREEICTKCGGVGQRLRGPSTTSHVVSRPFKCTKCNRMFTTRQDTRRKGGAR